MAGLYASHASNAPLPSSPSPLGERIPFLDSPWAYDREESPTPTTPRHSYVPKTSLSRKISGPVALLADKNESNEFLEGRPRPAQKKWRPALLIIISLLVLAIVVLAVMLPVYFTVIKPKQHLDANGTRNSTTGNGPVDDGNGNPESPTRVTSGGDGSTVTTEDGTTFTYENKFGGYWVSDPNEPFNNNARPNAWTPPLNQSWTWGKDRVFGVNLGGLFVLEPFISPALFQKYPGSVDEWSLSEMMAADTANGGLSQLEEHYKTFITEKDIAEIAGAGLNWVRLPIPYWAVEAWPGEPFLARTSWKYILRVIQWCRKYGIRVNLDLHTIPGSQNGYNHSGKMGTINFLNGVMGVANAQRALGVMRVITEFISQPQYKDVVAMFGIMNEPSMPTIGRSALTSFYLEAHSMIRNITGYGEGSGPYISIHDGFGGISTYADFLPGSDRIVLDTHPYFSFDGSPATSPIATGTGSKAGGVWPALACNRWASGINDSRSSFGVTVAGEFSNGFNDCGLYLRGIGIPTSYGGDCSDWENYSQWSDATKAGLQRFAMASMDALGDSFFWTWKIGKSAAGTVQAPLWSYQLGLQNGWMPKDPRTALGICESLGVSRPVFDGRFKPWQTGGVGAGTIAPSVTSQFPWPVESIAHAPVPASDLPVYTSTGSVPTLSPPTLTPSPTKSVDVGTGWRNTQDTAGAPTPIAGCTYPDGWDAVGVSVPPKCRGASATERTPALSASTHVPPSVSN